jgi:hypothetical protein
MAKEPVPFPTIRKFSEWPEPEIGRLIQHLSLAERENKDWVTVPTSDLREALIQLVHAAFNFTTTDYIATLTKEQLQILVSRVHEELRRRK